ncbi:MAG: DUF262 domain-containing protein [Polyangiaceae bacterium]|nr:DUF262 domain-containing protein [Polyangiaceae bacterium]
MPVDTELFPKLEQIAQAKTYSVKTLIFDELKRGKIRLPNFQRPLRWRAVDNAMLFDSLVRGYPIGSILLWRRPADKGALKIGNGTLDVEAAADAKWVVDGQQRIVALAAAMLEIPGQSKEYLVHFDPHAQEFFVPLRAADRREDEVPLTVLGDLAKLNRWLRAQGLSDELQDRLDRTHQRIVEYAVPAYEVDTPNEAPLRAVFARINSTGARMRADEVFHALLGNRSSERKAIQLDDLTNEVKGSGFGNLERSDALKCVLAASGLNPTHSPDTFDSAQLDKLVSTEEVARALGKTIDFLREDVQIPHLRLLPYPVVLILLVRFFHLHPEVAAADRVRLTRWVWRGAVTGLHQRAEVSRMREALRQMRDDSPSATIDRLLERFQKDQAIGWKLGPFDPRSAAARMVCLALWEKQPKRLPTLPGEPHGGPVEMDELLGSDRFAPEIYRMASLKTDELRAKGKSAANRILLADWRSVADLRHLNFDAHREFLDSHLIDQAMLNAVLENDQARFLGLRERALIQHVEIFLAKRAGYGEPLMAPLDAYGD